MSIDQNLRQKISDHALALLTNRNDIKKGETNVYLHQEPFAAGADVVTGLNRKVALKQASVVVLLDHAPQQNWGHPCEHLVYDAKNGDYVESIASEFPPASFFTKPDQVETLHAPVQLRGGGMPLLPRQIPQLEAALANATGQRYALLFSGMSNNRHLNDLEFLYRTLIDLYKFDPANITVLNYDGTLQYAGGPQPVQRWPGDNTAYRIKINGSGTNTALGQALDAFKGRLKADDLLLIHTNNHGGGPTSDPESWICCYPNYASFTATDFGKKIKALPAFNSLVVMMEQCHSGGFQNAVIGNTPAANTSFAAACRADASSIGGADFDPFARDWIAAVNGHNPNGSSLSKPISFPASMRVAFDYANAVKDPYDTPVYADKPADCGKNQFLTAPVSLKFRSSENTLIPTCNSDGRLEVFLVAQNGATWNLWQCAPHAGPWGGPNCLGGIVSQLTAALNSDGRLEIFGIGTDGAAYNNWQTRPHAGPWSGWNRLGGVVKQLVAICNADGRLELFGIGSDNALYNMWQTAPHAGPWSGWNKLGGWVKQIRAARNSDGRLEVFAIGSDNALYNIWQTRPSAGPWSGWNRLGGVVKEICAAKNSDGRLEVFGVGSDNALWHIWQTKPSAGPWSAWSSLGGVVRGLSAANNGDGRLEVFAIGSDNALWHTWQSKPSSGPWSGWSSKGGYVKEIGATCNSDGRLEVFAVGSDDALYNIWQTRPSSGPWSNWNKLTGNAPNTSNEAVPCRSLQAIY